MTDLDRTEKLVQTQDQIRLILQEIQDYDPNWRVGQIIHWVMTEFRHEPPLFYINDDTMLSGLKRVRQLLGIARMEEPIPSGSAGMDSIEEQDRANLGES